MKQERFELTSEGALPFLQFPDFQSWADSLSLKDLQRWDDILSNKKEEVHEETIRTAIGLYLMESKVDKISLIEKEIADLYNKFKIMTSLMHNVRIGHMKITTGRLSFLNDTAKFSLTEAGIKGVERMLGK